MPRSAANSGITLIEIMLVIALMLILGTATSPFLSNFITYTSFDSATQQIIGSLRKAQMYAMDRKQNQTWGVCRSGTIIKMYSGTCASSVTSDQFTIPGVVTVTGLSDVTFNTRGEPSSALTITVSTPIETKTITVTTTGATTIN